MIGRSNFGNPTADLCRPTLRATNRLLAGSHGALNRIDRPRGGMKVRWCITVC